MTETPPRRPLASFLRRPEPERKAVDAPVPAEGAPPDPLPLAESERPAPSPARTSTVLGDSAQPPSTSASEPTPGTLPSPTSATAPSLTTPAPDMASASATTSLASTETGTAGGSPSDDVAALKELGEEEVDPPAPVLEDGNGGSAIEPSARSLAVDAPPGTHRWSTTELPVVPATATPTFARSRTRAPSLRAPVWQWCALASLALVLVLQILIADRARLASQARWRPMVESLCGVLGCTLPPWHEPSAFSMLDREVRPVANQTGQLRIQASFRNDARWAQSWPWLQLSLSDADGRVIGTRVFAPTEYLGRVPAPADLLTPGQSARIDFRVREPAAGTAAFSFEFR